MKVLVAGWFSFPRMGATAGDLLAKDVVCRWLHDAGRPYDVAMAPPFEGGVDLDAANPLDYADVVFVCGPLGNGWPIPEFLRRFEGRRFTAVNVSMLDPLEVWNPFDLLLERDSSATARPDVAMVAPARSVPVTGVVLVHDQKEYADGKHSKANDAIRRLVASTEMAAVNIDTRLDTNATGLRTPAEVESLIAKMDVVVTTRLHGLVLAIKHGVPVVAIDPIGAGAKVLRQAQSLGWPAVLTSQDLTDAALAASFAWALTAEARRTARECRDRAVQQLASVRDTFVAAMAVPCGVVKQ
jgi:hypothetical protein